MIICAAIKHIPTGAVFGGIRHGLIHESMRGAGIWPHNKDIIEGFLDSENNFYDRTEAFKHALKCGQLSMATRWYKRDNREIELYSEDLY